MSFQTNQLYQTTIVSDRRAKDGIWDFFQKDNLKAPEWIHMMIQMIKEDFGDMLEEEYHHFLDELDAASISHYHYALWFACLNWYPNMKNFLMTSEDFERADINLLAIFLEQELPKTFKQWKEGHYSSTKVWTRHVMATYAVTVPCLV